jgi:hypothetical protein
MAQRLIAATLLAFLSVGCVPSMHAFVMMRGALLQDLPGYSVSQGSSAVSSATLLLTPETFEDESGLVDLTALMYSSADGAFPFGPTLRAPAGTSLGQNTQCCADFM